MSNKNFAGSNTYIFSMVYPWVIFLGFALLGIFNVIDILSIPEKYVIALAIIPVIISVVWFLIKNRGLHKLP